MSDLEHLNSCQQTLLTATPNPERALIPVKVWMVPVECLPDDHRAVNIFFLLLLSYLKLKKSNKMEDRDRKYWEVSEILDSWDYYKKAYPEATKHEFINRRLDDLQAQEDCYRSLIEYDKRCQQRNQRILKAIKNVKGKTFYKHILDIIAEGEGIDGMAVIVRVPSGKFQEEKHGKEIDGIWIDQWSVGMEGDSFEGIICVKIKKDRYLKFSYKM